MLVTRALGQIWRRDEVENVLALRLVKILFFALHFYGRLLQKLQHVRNRLLCPIRAHVIFS